MDDERRALVLPPFRENALRALAGLPGVEVVQCPRETGDRLFDVASETITRYRCTHVVATAERNMALAGRLRDRHCLPGLNGIQSLAVTDKRCMRLWAEPLVPMARAWPASDVLADPSVLGGLSEVVVKPAVGSACHGVDRVSVTDVLRHLAVGSGPRLVEAALNVDAELHCDGYFLDRRVVSVTVAAYDRPVLAARGATIGSMILPAGHRWAGRARPLIAALLAGAPAPHGVFHAELLIAGDELHFGEIALRPGASGVAESLRVHFGIDVWDAFVRLQVGLPPAPPAAAGLDASWRGYIGVVADQDGEAAWRAETLRGLPGVVAVERVPGAWAKTSDSSCSFSWHVFYRAGSDDEVRHLMGAVSRVVPAPRQAAAQQYRLGQCGQPMSASRTGNSASSSQMSQRSDVKSASTDSYS